MWVVGGGTHQLSLVQVLASVIFLGFEDGQMFGSRITLFTQLKYNLRQRVYMMVGWGEQSFSSSIFLPKQAITMKEKCNCFLSCTYI